MIYVVLGQKQLANLDKHELFCYLKRHVKPDRNDMPTQEEAKGKGSGENVVIPKDMVG